MVDGFGRLCTVPQNEVHESAYPLEFYPEIYVQLDAFNTSAADCTNASMNSWRNVIVSVDEGVFKRITRTFFESGFKDALNEACDPQTGDKYPIICALAKSIAKVIDFGGQMQAKIFPHKTGNGIAAVADFSETRDWMRSCIRYIAWHPNCFKIAVAGADDHIRIYTDEPAVVPLLKNTSQRWITSMAWRPHSAGELAVGCRRGVYIWTIDSNTHIMRAASHSTFLKSPNHTPITSVQWHSDGALLAAASIANTNILIWHVDKMQSTLLQRLNPHCALLKWSPDGGSLLTTTTSNVFRVWAMERKWTPERWTIAEGNVQSACWSSCSTFLLFVTTNDSLLYSMQFLEEQVFTSENVPKQALPMADLSQLVIGDRVVGGQPQALAWCPNGMYLAVTFKDSPCIAIYTTYIQRFTLTLTPNCFISGVSNEYPSFICFQSKNRRNSNSILTIGWSSGRVQYFPFVNM